jgi:endoglucanase
MGGIGYSRAMTPAQHAFLKDLLSRPTAPFFEHHVVRFASAWLQRQQIPFFTDPAGNLVIGSPSAREYRRLLNSRGREPLRVFIAHMDHPGFHGVRWLAADRLKVRWHGGSPIRYLAGSRVWLADAERMLGQGKLGQVSLTQSGRAMESAVLRLTHCNITGRRPAASRLFGGFEFRAPVWQRGKRLYTRAADDLVGVFAILQTAKALRQTPSAGRTAPFVGLLTRGEEVGFVGALAHLQLGWLSRAHRPLVCISLEASRTLPRAKIGKGPVVRLGDWRTVFSADGSKILADVAAHRLPDRHQKRIMDGGSCEATATTAYGLQTVGISVPLGNYHNQGFEGGMDCPHANGPAPEFVHLDDVDGLLGLCRGLMQGGLNWRDPWGDTRERLLKNMRRYARHLGR